MSNTKDYAFASGGILWKVLDRSRFESKSIKRQISFVIGLMLLCWLPIALLSLSQTGVESVLSSFSS